MRSVQKTTQPALVPNLNRRQLLVAGASAAMLAPLAACEGAPGRQMLATDTQPDGYPTVEALRFFSQELENRTGGELKTQIYPSSQLGSQNDTLELAQFGGIDFLRVNVAPLNVLVPETAIPALPFVFRSIGHMRRSMDGDPGEKILGALSDHGLIGLAFYDSGARSFYTRDRAINEPADLKGLKIRVQTSDLFVSMVEALGGNATPMAYGEVYQGLVQKVIDGAENNFPSYESSRHFEVAQTYSLTRHVMAPEILAMSRYRWEKLSAEEQDHVRSAAKASVPVMRKLWDGQVEASKAVLQEAGVRLVETIDTTAFQTKVEPVWQDYMTDPASSKLVEDIQNMGGNND